MIDQDCPFVSDERPCGLRGISRAGLFGHHRFFPWRLKEAPMEAIDRIDMD